MVGNIGAWAKGTTLKRSNLLVAVAVTALTACAGGVPSGSPSGSATSPPLAVSPSSSPASTPTPAPATATNASCHEVAFYLDPALASGFTCETIPASNDPSAPFPEFTRVTLTGYATEGSYVNPQISVMSIADYTAMDPSRIPGFVATLRSYAEGGDAPAFNAQSEFPIPVLPEGVAGAALLAKCATVPFADGGGVRFLTQFATEVSVYANDALLYAFEGTTSDGAYWVTVMLPIQNPVLPADGNDPPGGQTWDQFDAGYSAYALATAASLDGQPPGAFTPGLEQLDALVASITISP
jgi:hypothetical protein